MLSNSTGYQNPTALEWFDVTWDCIILTRLDVISIHFEQHFDSRDTLFFEEFLGGFLFRVFN